jgi:hypothetical protein
MAWYKSISLKIILSIVGIVVAVNGIQAYQSLTVVEKQLNDMVLKTASQLSETIKKSIQSDMLLNRKEHAYKIMETIGRQEGIEKVRIYSKEGRILFSSDYREIEGMVDKRAEPATGAMPRPGLSRAGDIRRSRIFHSTDAYGWAARGIASSGSSAPLQREGCSSAACHAPQSIRSSG